ncbi:MAG TPA: type II toxin-antitoxin system VapC family toxin [Rhizobiaceae bacterium]|nr:type II toxin-antitoxin system VapC family toxin [Rhizobiaceae bacterium]
MKITPDTNVLVRLAVQDDPKQAEQAIKFVADAELIAVPVTTLCEFVWVLQRGHKRSAESIAASIKNLLKSGRVVANSVAIDAGLRFLISGGDFADGAIAVEGAQLGGTEFVTFDKKAAKLIEAAGGASVLLR